MSTIDSIWFEAGTWFALVALFLFTVPNWGSMKVFDGAGNMSQDEYEALSADIAENATCGSFILRNSWALIILQIARNLALWLAWFYFLVLSPATNQFLDAANGGTTNGTFYVIINSLLFAAVVFHVLAENWFWQLASFGASFALRIIELIVYVAAAIIVWIYYAGLPAKVAADDDTPAELSYGQILFLGIVLTIIVLHVALILLPRNYQFWSRASETTRYQQMGGAGNKLIPSAASPQQHNSAAHMRAASALWQQQAQYAK